jgi:hypothetical protein
LAVSTFFVVSRTFFTVFVAGAFLAVEAAGAGVAADGS